MEQTARLTIFAIVAAIGIIGVLVVVESFVIPLQQAEARGCESVPRNISQNATPFIASQGRCFGHGHPP